MMRYMIASVAVAAAVAGLSLSGTSASAFTSRDCKLYGYCDYNGYTNTYQGYGQQRRATPAAPAPSGEMRPESGITGPHGVGWY